MRTLGISIPAAHGNSADYLHSEFQLSIPDAWSNTLADDSSNVPDLTGPMQVAAEHEFDDDFLLDIIEHEQPPDEPLSFAECYLGYNLYLYRRRSMPWPRICGRAF